MAMLVEVLTFLQQETGERLFGARLKCWATESPAGHIPTLLDRGVITH